jgi:hypothetical protein
MAKNENDMPVMLSGDEANSIGACGGRDVLLLGLWNMVWGRSANTSQALMRWRVVLHRALLGDGRTLLVS